MGKTWLAQVTSAPHVTSEGLAGAYLSTVTYNFANGQLPLILWPSCYTSHTSITTGFCSTLCLSKMHVSIALHQPRILILCPFNMEVCCVQLTLNHHCRFLSPTGTALYFLWHQMYIFVLCLHTLAECMLWSRFGMQWICVGEMDGHMMAGGLCQGGWA